MVTMATMTPPTPTHWVSLSCAPARKIWRWSDKNCNRQSAQENLYFFFKKIWLPWQRWLRPHQAQEVSLSLHNATSYQIWRWSDKNYSRQTTNKKLFTISTKIMVTMATMTPPTRKTIGVFVLPSYTFMPNLKIIQEELQPVERSQGNLCGGWR